jgi:hypothetical protein
MRPQMPGRQTPERAKTDQADEGVGIDVALV